MKEHLSSASLKSLAKGQLLGKYGTVIGACAIHLAYIAIADFSTTLMVDTGTVLGNIIYYIVSLLVGIIGCVFVYGESYLYLKIACNQQISVNDLFIGFRNAHNKLLPVAFVMTAVGLICGLPSLMLPSVMANPEDPYKLLLYVVLMLITTIINLVFNLTFSQCYYLMLDFPQYSPKEIFKLSHKVMKGSKGRLFYIEISLLPLYLLGICTCCVGFLWIYPYMYAIKANFYLDLMKKRSA